MANQIAIAMAAVIGGVVSVGSGTYIYNNYEFEKPASLAVVEPVKPDAKPGNEVASLQRNAEPVITAPKKTEEVQPPQFDILRVEKDGSVIIAGSAQPGSKVEIIDRGKVIAKSKAASNGDFAIVFDEALKPGAYELFIRSTKDDSSIVSQQAGIISIPDDEGDVIAMVSKAGEASKLIQRPQPKPIPVKKQEPEKTDVVKLEPTQVPVIAKTEPDEVKNSPPITKTQPKPLVDTPIEKQQPVLLGAVEVEDEKIFVAGTGEPGRAVNIYIDDKYIGAAKVSTNGSFLLEADATLNFGNHNVRADMLKRNSAQVSARAQVPLIHHAPIELQVAAKKPPELVAPFITKTAPAKTVVEVAANEPAAPTIAPKITLEKPRLQSEEKIAALTKAKPSSAPITRNIASPTSPTVGANPKIVVVEKPKMQIAAVEKPKQVIRTGSSVIIRSGDNLWQVSRRILGRGIHYSTIYNANRQQIKDPKLIFPGQIFKIPGKMANTTPRPKG